MRKVYNVHIWFTYCPKGGAQEEVSVRRFMSRFKDSAVATFEHVYCKVLLSVSDIEIVFMKHKSIIQSP